MVVVATDEDEEAALFQVLQKKVVVDVGSTTEMAGAGWSSRHRAF